MDEIEYILPKRDDSDDGESSKTKNVESLMLTKSNEDCNGSLQVGFDGDCKGEQATTGELNHHNTDSAISASSVSSPLNITNIELNDAGILLESGDVIQNSLDTASNSMQLEAGKCFTQTLAIVDESDSCDGNPKFIDGQAVQLEDGSTAFLHALPREGLQPVQLEDGTLAYLSQTREELFNGEASGLDLEQLSSPQMQAENAEEKEAVVEVAATKESQVKSSQTRTTASGSEKAFPCQYEGCNRVYTTPHHLKVHERSHTGDRPFKCSAPKCGKAFATGYGLKSHVRVHTGETPYKCVEASCTKAFKTSGDLQKHLRTHTGERPFKCTYPNCDRAFTTSNIRKVHIRTHTGEKPYICDSCGRAFASATNFKNHIRIHTGEKPYQCNFQGCNKKFTEYSSLYKHHIVHTRDKPYVCTTCGKNYRQTSTLAMHERTAHKNLPAKKSVATSVDEENICIDVKIEPGEGGNRIACLQLVSEDLTQNQTAVIENNNSSTQENSGSCSMPKKLPAIISVQACSSQLLQEHTPVYAIQLQTDGSSETAQQIILIADPGQLTSLQPLTQVQLQSIVAQAPGNGTANKTD